MPSHKPRELSAAKRRELQVAGALAREAVLQLHVTRALQLLELAGSRVAPARMLGIYVRVQSLPAKLGESVTNRALASFGKDAGGNAHGALSLVDEPDHKTSERSLLLVVRNRLRGRVNHNLRRWVELQSGATEVALLEVHLQHARRFLRELAATHSIHAACEAYADLAEVPAHMRPVLYIFVLNRLAAEELPRSRPAARPLKEKASAQPLPAQRKHAERKRGVG